MPSIKAAPTHVVESLPLNTDVHIEADSITVAFRSMEWAPLYLTPRLFEQRIGIVLDARYHRSDPDARYELASALRRLRFRARYIRFAGGTEVIVFDEKIVIPAHANIHWQMSPRLRERVLRQARITPPMTIGGLALEGNRLAIFRDFRVGLCSNRYSLPFTHAELCGIKPYTSLEQPVPLRPAFDSSYSGLVKEDKFGNNALVDCCSISIPLFYPITWTDERLRAVRGLMSVPEHIYPSLIEFVRGRRVLAVKEDRLFDGVNGEWPHKRKRRREIFGQCFNGQTLTIVGSSLVFHENNTEAGEFHVLDSLLYAFGLKVYAFKDHALGAAANPQLGNPFWRKPYCLYALAHDHDGRWASTYLPRFLQVNYAARRDALVRAMAEGISGEVA